LKLNNNLVVFDLEATSKKTDAGRTVNNDIIQIGAVLINREFKVVSEFDTLVKNREVISDEITTLTGITNDACATAPTFDDASRQFEGWIGQHVTNIKNVRLVAWGTHFDEDMLRKHYAQYNRDYPYSGTVFDVKTWAMLYMMLHGQRTDKLKMEHVAKFMGLVPTGAYHNALVDARMEGAIALKVFETLGSCFFLDGKPFKVVSNT